MKICDIKTGYIFLVHRTTRLGDTIEGIQGITHSRDKAKWTHSGVIKLDYDGIKAVEMTENGSEKNFLSKYKVEELMICIPKFFYKEDEAAAYLESRIGKVKYNFKRLGQILLRAITFGLLDFTTRKSDEELCSEFCIDYVNNVGHFMIEKEGKEPADIAEMDNLFTFETLEW